MTRLLWLAITPIIAGCGWGQLERTDETPLTTERAAGYQNESGQAQSYNRHNLNSLYLVDYGRVVDTNKIQLSGTHQTGAQVGGLVGGLNTLNSGTTSTESAIIRILGGAIIGAALENSLTQGEALEYIIERRDGQLVSLVTQYNIPMNSCVMMRTDSATQKTALEVKNQGVCDNLMGER